MATENNKAINENQIRTLRDSLTNALRAKDVNGVNPALCDQCRFVCP